LRIRPLTTGVVRHKAGGRGIRHYLVDEWRPDALPVNAYLVEHPGGAVLFDTGQTARAAGPGWFPRWHPWFRLSRFELTADDEVAAQLRRLDVQVGTVVLSHLHTDHVGGLDALADAEVLVPRVEWEHATGVRGALRGYLPRRWPAGVKPTPVDFTGPPVGPFSASFDVRGDGTLLFVPTPGHTPGHAALLVRDAEGAALLAGDMAHTSAELAEGNPRVAEWCAAEGVSILTAHELTT
jgi:glyoxylase-like metal-dependent hydrolase (beta-lactamase superfamily II)